MSALAFAGLRPRVSVVVPTYLRPDLLARCVAALRRQTMPPEAYEIVIVDDGHSDATRDWVGDVARGDARGPAVRYRRPASGRGPAVARNVGWRAASAPIVAFTDDDTIPDARWLSEGTAFLEAADGSVAGAAGRIDVPSSGRTCAPTDHELMTRGLATAEFVTANAFLRHDALTACGGFDERFRRAWREDSDLQFTLIEQETPILRADAAVVLHPVRPERWGVSLRQQKNVFYDALLFKKHRRLYRERILARPPWDYYAIVVATPAAVALAAFGHGIAAAACAAVALGLVGAFAARRLRRTSHAPGHVAEMVVTSLAIPFLSVYWRLRGAAHFRVAYW